MTDNLIKEAEKLAKNAHKDQKQLTGQPYFEHPKKVAEFLKKRVKDKDVIIAGFLHDIVEDSGISLTFLKKEFGKRVSFLVDGMSWERDKKTKIKDWPKSYKKFADYSKKEPYLVLIKLGDLISNIPNIRTIKNREFIINKSWLRNKRFFLPFLKEAGFKQEILEIEKEFNKYTQKRVKSVLYEYISKKELKEIRERLK